MKNLILFTLISMMHVQAQTTPYSNDQFEDQMIHEVTKNNITQKGLFSEVADGGNLSDLYQVCDPKDFEKNLLAQGTPHDTKVFHDKLRTFLYKCAGSLNRNAWKGILSLYKFSKYQYDFLSNPHIRKQVITLPRGVKVPAIIALKPGAEKRPLVLIKCGVFCSADSSPSTRNFLMNLFDQSPFHVVFLANNTGSDYISENKYVTLGGHYEAFETYEVGQWLLSQWEHKDKVSSLHLAGLSLGGSTAVMGSYYNESLKKENEKPLFNSVMAICPVMDLKPTLQYLFERSIASPFFYTATRNFLLSSQKKVTDVPDLITEQSIPDKWGMTDFLGYLAAYSKTRRGQNTSPQQFFDDNNFFNSKSERTTPLLIWSSSNDFIVNPAYNNFQVSRHPALAKSPNVGSLNLYQGSHCAFNSSYGVQATSMVYRTFVLNHSPEFLTKYKKEKKKISLSKVDVSFKHVHMNQKWRFYPKYEKAKVTFKVFNGFNSVCRGYSPMYARADCYEYNQYWVPVSELADLGGRVPQNDSEAQMLTREFNAKTEFVSSKGPLNGSSEKEFELSYYTGY